jgi:hypothetical protein
MPIGFPFEHKQKPLLPFRAFVSRQLRFTAFAILLILVSLFLGMAGYHGIAGLSWVDAFYNASMILTGMGPVAPMQTTGAKVFAGTYALFSGVVFLSTAAVLLAPLLHRLLHRLHMEPEGDDADTPADRPL